MIDGSDVIPALVVDWTSSEVVTGSTCVVFDGSALSVVFVGRTIATSLEVIDVVSGTESTAVADDSVRDGCALTVEDSVKN